MKHPLYARQMASYKHHLFYDETNNFRKLILDKEQTALNTDNGEFNNTIFYLGGIALINGYNAEDELRDAFLKFKNKVNKQKQEIKFDDVAKRDFLSVLKSAHLNQFLKLLVDYKVCIHYQAIEVIYMITTDLIDEIQVIEQFYELYPAYAYELRTSNICPYFKNTLHSVFRQNSEAFLQFVSETNFPKIRNSEEFINQFIAFIKGIKTKDNLRQIEMILDVFESIPDKSEVYCDGYPVENNKLMLVNSFSGYYYHRITTLSNSIHTFDQEDEIQIALRNLPEHVKNNFSFIDSKTDFRIQMSDILIGFVRNFMDYHIQETIESSKNNFKKMNNFQKECIANFLILEDESQKNCPFFLLSVLPEGDKAKMYQIVNFYKAELNLT